MTERRIPAAISDERLRLSIDHLHEGLQVLGFDWTYLYLNETAARQGQRARSDLLGRSIMECYPGIEGTELFGVLQQAMHTRRPASMRNEFVYPSGERRWFDLRIEPVPDGICILSLDITELRRIELQLQQAQKLEALGRLAGGVAHDFNNQLTAILGYTEMMLEQIDKDKPIWADLCEIKEAAERSAALTRQLLAFSRRQVLNIEPLNLNDVVRDVARMLQRLLGEDVACDIQLEPDLPLIRADVGQLSQVLSNLAVNARDAMPDGGRLTIGTSSANLTQDEARQRATMAPGRYAVLDVSDTGHGMDAATQARIFEPFFTTKEQGKGTGLGLAVVYGIVQQMGGFIWVYSEPGRGTRFRLYLPVTDQPQRVKAPPTTGLNEPGRERILVVEDEAGVRALTVRALRRHGYTVLEAASAAEAKALFRDGAGEIALVLTDVVLPDQAGPDLIAELEQHRPIRALYMSGYSERHVHDRRLDVGRLMEKPFTVQDLLQRVRASLDGR